MSRPKEKESRHLNLTLDVNVIARLDAMAAAEKTSRTRVVEGMVNEFGAAQSASARRNYAGVSAAQTLLNQMMQAAPGLKVEVFSKAIEAAETALDGVLNSLAVIAFPDAPRPAAKASSLAAEPAAQTSIPSDASELKVQEQGRKPAAPAPSVDKPARVGQTPRPATAARKGKAPRA